MNALATLAALLLATAAHAEPILLKPDRVFTAEDRVAHTGWRVLVEGGKIAAVGPNLAAPAGARTLSLPGTTLIPGLIETHSHLFLHPYDEVVWDDQVLKEPLAYRTARAWFLPRLVGLPQALRWCLSGRLISAEEALAGGLVAEIVEPDALLARAREIALEIAQNTAPVSIALTRQMLWAYCGDPDPFRLLKIDGALALELGGGPDVREGVAAFLEKRPPQFPGKVSTDMPARWATPE